jgi:cobaltochelatase CobN
MHLFAAKPGGFVDDEGIIDLEQSPADIVILSAADSSLSALANAANSLPENFPSIRLANWMHLRKPAAFDLYQDKVLDSSQLVVLSLLGGQSYWEYGFEQLQTWARENAGRQLIIVPGDDAEDRELFTASTVSINEAIRVWRFLREGGSNNSEHLFKYLADEYLNYPCDWHEPKALPKSLIYLPQKQENGTDYPELGATLAEWKSSLAPQVKANQAFLEAPVCIILFYRSHLQNANTAMFDDFIQCVQAQGLKPLPVAVSSLKDAESLALVNHLIEQSHARVILNTTGFASNSASLSGSEFSAATDSGPSYFISPFINDIPVIQVMLSSTLQEDWADNTQGLNSRDLAMQVVLPEMDGRVISRAISFKTEDDFDERCEISLVRYAIHLERANWVASLAKRYCELVTTPNTQKRIALILANYPTKDGRIGNGVGLDTPASALSILKALKLEGYPVDELPDTGTGLIEALMGSVTNNPNTLHQLPCWQSVSLENYQRYFQMLPKSNQTAIYHQWGNPEQDPKFRQGRLMIAGIRSGETFIGIQPARGFDRDLAANYHDPDLIPPHSYLAFYFWLRHEYQVSAVIHVGKHGNLEWLPGKGSALSNECWPDLILGPLPNFYPFIVNDPGEGAQAKRRTQAVIIDHLMPPMTRAETYGDLAELEGLVDEYYQALGMDVRRENWLKDRIILLTRETNILQELNCNQTDLSKEVLAKPKDSDQQVLDQLDAYLCDIKEAQIRHGLHILGALPDDPKLAETIVALLRLPRGNEADTQGILHSIAGDLNLQSSSESFNPLAASTENWRGARPNILLEIDSGNWRTEADTRERLELMALKWVADYLIGSENLAQLEDSFPQTYTLLTFARQQLVPALEKSAQLEIQSLTQGLCGLFVPPGPSGAPTRGRLDTLPTGRNFFSVDSRAIPSPAAWALGEKSAEALVARYLQEQGEYPKQLGLSVWGTATMRTGGDDIAQAFSLMGVKPIWATGSNRVVDFEIIPCMLLGRPRVDVTLRVSGFFRDAFANVMRLYDAAVQALVVIEEPGNENMIRQHVDKRYTELVEQGMPAVQAKREASYRVFGSKPGAYGAGLQGLIDERCWEQKSDLAEAYVNWGGYAYGNHSEKEPQAVAAPDAFRHQLSQLEAVVQNQDNREHDLLDSDDYYQFQGGMANAVNVYRGQMPVVFHGDHSNPESPKIRTLKEELNRVIRSRVLNPKWIHAMQEHGYKGAFEMAATIDYLFAYDATTDFIDDYQYQQVAQALIFDKQNQAFMRAHNLSALEEMTERMLEATQRNMWQATEQDKQDLQNLLLDIDAEKEG